MIRKKRNSVRKPHIIVFIIFGIIWGIFTIYPLIFTFLASFKTNDEIYLHMFNLPNLFSIDNYVDAVVVGKMIKAIINSLFLAGMGTVLFLILSLGVSFALTRTELKGKSFFNLYFGLGIMIPIHTTLLPLVSMANKLKLNNKYSFLIILYATFQLSLSIYLIKAHMKGISMELDESAMLDGCSPLRILTSIITPLCAPSLATAGILGFLAIYNELIFAILFISKKELLTISIGLMAFAGERVTKLGPRFAAIMISISPMIIVYLLLQEKIEKGIMAGAIKG